MKILAVTPRVTISAGELASLDPEAAIPITAFNFEDTWPQDKDSSWAYLNKLLISNVLCKNNEKIRRACYLDIKHELRSLSDDNLIKLAQIIKVLEKNKDKLSGVSFECGGARAIFPGLGAAIVFRIISDLLGVSYNDENPTPSFNTFSGNSGASILAACMAVKMPVQDLYKICSHDFSNLPGNPKFLMSLLDGGLKASYYHSTSREVNGDLTNKHLKEIGSRLCIPLGIHGGGFLGNLIPQEIFYLPEDPTSSSQSLNVDGISIPWIVTASCNLLPLFRNSESFYFNHPTLTDNKTVYLVDPGCLSKNSLPLEATKQALLGDKIMFSVGASKPRTTLKTFEFGGNPSYLKRWLAASMDILVDSFDYISGERVEKTIDRLGTLASHVKTTYQAYDQKKGRMIKVSTGQFATPEDLITLVKANRDLVINQLHNSLVDEEYLQSKGINSFDAHAIWKSQVERTRSLSRRQSSRTYPQAITSQPEINRAIVEARQSIGSVKKLAHLPKTIKDLAAAASFLMF